MKKLFLLSFALLLSCSMIKAQSVPYNVVFDVTSKDTVVHQMVIRWVNEILKTAPTANIEVVFYAKSLDMVTGQSVVAAEVKRLAGTKNVSFSVCEVAMLNNNLKKEDLLPGVGTVPDGIYELISKQAQGWGYIKAAR